MPVPLDRVLSPRRYLQGGDFVLRRRSVPGTHPLHAPQCLSAQGRLRRELSVRRSRQRCPWVSSLRRSASSFRRQSTVTTPSFTRWVVAPYRDRQTTAPIRPCPTLGASFPLRGVAPATQTPTPATLASWQCHWTATGPARWHCLQGKLNAPALVLSLCPHSSRGLRHHAQTT